MITYATDAVSVVDTSITMSDLEIMSVSGNGITLTYTTGPRTVSIADMLMIDVGDTAIEVNSVFNVTVSVDGVTIAAVASSGVTVVSDNNATLTFTDSSILSPGLGTPYGVLCTAVYDASVTVTGSEISDTGADVIALSFAGDAIVHVTDSTLGNVVGSNTYAVAAISFAPDSVSISVTGSTIENVTTGVFASAIGSIDVTVSDSTFNLVTVNAITVISSTGAADLALTGCSFNASANVVSVQAQTGVSATVNDVIVTNSTNGFNFWSATGLVDVTMSGVSADLSGNGVVLGDPMLPLMTGTASLDMTNCAISGVFGSPAIEVISNQSIEVALTDVLINHTTSGVFVLSITGDVGLDISNVTIVADVIPPGPPVDNFGLAVLAPEGSADVDIDLMPVVLYQDVDYGIDLILGPGDDGIQVLANNTVDVEANEIMVVGGYAGMVLTSISGDVDLGLTGYVGINTVERGIEASAAGNVELDITDVYIDSYNLQWQTFSSYSLSAYAGGTIEANVDNFVAYAVLFGWDIEATSDVGLTVSGVTLSSSTDAVNWTRMYSGIYVQSSVGGVDASFTDTSLWMSELSELWFYGDEYAIDIYANLTVNLAVQNLFADTWIDGIYAWTNSGDITATFDGMTVNDTVYAGVELYAQAGLIDLTISSSSIDNSFGVAALVAQCGGDLTVDLTSVEMLVSGGYGMNLLTTDGNLDLSLSDIDFEEMSNDAVRGVAANGEVVAVVDPSLIDSIDGNGIYLDSALGLEFDMVDSMINDTTTGVRLIAANTLLDISIEGSVISNCSEWAMQAEIEDGPIEFEMTASQVLYTDLGIDLVTHNGPIDVTVTGSDFEHNFAFGLLVQGTNGDETVDISATTVNDVNGYGIAIETINGTQDITLTGDTITNCGTGLDAETDIGDITLLVDTCTFQYCIEGVDLNSGANAFVTVTGSEVLATYSDGMTVDAAIDVFLTVTDSTFNGADAANAETFVPTSSDAEYAIVNPGDVNWTYPYDEAMIVPLGFAFPFNGNVYTALAMSSFGWISPDLIDPFVVYNFDSDNVNLIAPTQYAWYGDAFPGMGWKVNDSRGLESEGPVNIVFQWYVWDPSQPTLKNVFEVWLYPSGDIEFRYAMMNGDGVGGAPYGISMQDGPKYDLRMIEPSFTDMAWTNLLFKAQFLSQGGGLLTVAGWNTTATVTGSEFSSYVDYGLSMTSENGWMNVEVTESSFSDIYDDGYGALHVTAYSDAMDLLVENNQFSFLYASGVEAWDSPTGDLVVPDAAPGQPGVSSSMIIINNEFNEVMMTFDIGSTVRPGVNEEQVFNGVKTFSNNVGTHVGTGDMYTTIYPAHLNWTITETDTMNDNDLGGLVSIWLQMLGGPGFGPMLGSNFVMDNGEADWLSTITADYVVTADFNQLNEPGFFLLDTTMGIDSYASVSTDGQSSVEFTSTFEAVWNNITAAEEPFTSGIVAYVEADSDDSDLSVTTTMTIENNNLTYPAIFESYGISAETYANGHDSKGTVVLDATVSVVDNKVICPGIYEGIYVGAGLYTYNMVGEMTETVESTVSGNEVSGAFQAIDVEYELAVEFNVYFPPYETNVTASGTLGYTSDITDNVISDCLYGVYTWLETSALGDEYGVFSQATATSKGAFTITGNTIESYDLGVKVEIDTDSRADTSVASTGCTLTLMDNEIWDGVEIDSYTSTWTDEARYFDMMTATTDLTLVLKDLKLYDEGIIVTQIVNNGAYDPMFGWDSYSGSGVATLNSNIVANNITVSAPEAEAEYGVAVYTSLSNRMDEETAANPLATADVDFTATNITADGSGMFDSVGVGIAADLFDDWTSYTGNTVIMNNVVEDYDFGIFAEVPTAVLIENNSVSFCGIGIEVNEADFQILDNSVFDCNVGIEVNFATGVIGSNKIDGNADGSDGIDVYESVGVQVTRNLIANVTDDGMEANYDDDLVISDNTFTNIGDNGLDIYSVGALNVTNNKFTTIGAEAMDLDSLGVYEDVGTLISGNTINGAFTGIWIDQSEFVLVTKNTMSNVYNGIGVEYSDQILIDNNVLSGLPAGDDFEFEVGGIYVYESSFVEVNNTIVTGFENGVYAAWSSDVKFTWLSIGPTVEDGLYVSYSSDIAVENCTISNSGYDGAYFEQSSNIIFANNVVSSNGLDGLYIYESWDVLILNGAFENNGLYGVFIEDAGVDWIVTGTSSIKANPIEAGALITVMPGGVLSMVEVHFYVDYAYYDDLPGILVMNGGSLSFVDSYIEDWDVDYYIFQVFGTLDMSDSTVDGAIELLLGEGSNATIETSTIAFNDMNGIHAVSSSPTILGTSIIGNGRNGVRIDGPNAAPRITDCIIVGNERGVYAVSADLKDVTDNLFILNYEAGVFAEKVTGLISGNTFLFNGKEIYVRDSNVSVMFNDIGYTPLVQVLAQFVPLMVGDPADLGEIFGYTLTDLNAINALLLHHTGLYAVNSTVVSSGNTYGLLTTAVIVTDGSKLTFADTVEQGTLIVPYMGKDSVIRNMSLPISIYDGLVIIDSELTMNGAKVDALDDALFLDGSRAMVTNSALSAMGISIFAMDGSNATVTASTFGKAVAVDTSVIHVSSMLVVMVTDPNGAALAGVPVKVVGMGVNVSGVTDANGAFSTPVAMYDITAAGSGETPQTYNVTVDFSNVPTTPYGSGKVWNPAVVTQSVTITSGGVTTLAVQGKITDQSQGDMSAALTLMVLAAALIGGVSLIALIRRP